MKSYIGFIVYNELCISPKLLYLTISHYRGWGGGQIQLFPNMVMLHIKSKGIESYSNMVANILPLDKPLTRRSLKVKLFFSGRSNVVYQIKGNGAQNNMPACLWWILWSAHDDLSNQFEPRSKLRDFFFIFSSYLWTYTRPWLYHLNPGKAQQKVQLDLDSSCLQNFIQLADMTPKIIATMLLHTWFPLIWYATWPCFEKVGVFPFDPIPRVGWWGG